MSALPSSIIVPLQPVGSQTLNVTLNNQVCNINIYGKQINIPEGPDPPIFVPACPVFMDLDLNNSSIVSAVLCLNQVLIVRNTYFGFIGDFIFVDTQGNDDPLVGGLGSRWLLVYLPSAP
jgi:hypothetical protein